ncbi:MAG: hypothetical protein NZM11_06485 [Anaerolineales bacterium]|nr:hypothetical protein [Anaerolineales bacterium]
MPLASRQKMHYVIYANRRARSAQRPPARRPVGLYSVGYWPNASGACPNRTSGPIASNRADGFATQTGRPVSTQTVVTNSAGVLSLAVNNLANDIAVRITR